MLVHAIRLPGHFASQASQASQDNLQHSRESGNRPEEGCNHSRLRAAIECGLSDDVVSGILRTRGRTSRPDRDFALLILALATGRYSPPRFMYLKHLMAFDLPRWNSMLLDYVFSNRELHDRDGIIKWLLVEPGRDTSYDVTILYMAVHSCAAVAVRTLLAVPGRGKSRDAELLRLAEKKRDECDEGCGRHGRLADVGMTRDAAEVVAVMREAVTLM